MTGGVMAGDDGGTSGSGGTTDRRARMLAFEGDFLLGVRSTCACLQDGRCFVSFERGLLLLLLSRLLG